MCVNYILSCKKEIRDISVRDIENWPRGYKTFFMLNSAEHEILNARKYKKINKLGFLRLRKA